MSDSMSYGEILLSDSKIASSAAAERFRMIRAKLERLNMKNSSKYRVLSITSAVAQEGKSLTSCNLARALSLDPYGKTIIIDCDFRRPATHMYFDISLEPGFSDAIQGTHSLESVIRPYSERLDIVTAGSYITDTAQAIESPRVPEFLTQLRENYRYVVLDCPPVLLCPEPITLSSLTDATLMVVRGWQTDRRLVEDAVSVIGRDKLLGVVLNDVEDVSSEYLHYGYYSERKRAEIKVAQEEFEGEK